MKRRIYNFGSSAAMVKKSSALGVAAVLLGVGGIIITGNNSAEQAGALTYQSSVTNSFTIQPSVSITFDENIKDLVINDLTPGGAADSNTITLTVETNNATGYTVSSTVGDGTTYQNANLIHEDDGVADVFTSLGTSDTVTNLEDIDAGKWGYNFSLNGGAWQGYSGLPYSTLVEGTYTPAPALLVDTGSAADKTAASTIEFKIAASSSDTQAAGEYSNVINFITTVYPAEEGGGGGNYMQTVTEAQLASLMPNAGDTTTLEDERDGTEYTIAKLDDGYYWMVENMKLGKGGGEVIALDSSNSNLPEGKTFNLKASGMGSNSPDATNGDCNVGDWYPSNTAAYFEVSHLCINTVKPEYGTYYNWYTATAGTGLYSTASGDADGSICPNGWRLPPNSGEKSYYNLLTTKMGLSGSAGVATMQEAPLSFLLSGNTYGTGLDDQGTDGNYWSSTANNNTDAYNLNFNGSTVNPQGDNSKGNGDSVRCVFGS